ncbi:MAG: hypothetical protein ABI321_20050 [Polyangia bacterium]
MSLRLRLLALALSVTAFVGGTGRVARAETDVITDGGVAPDASELPVVEEPKNETPKAEEPENQPPPPVAQQQPPSPDAPQCKVDDDCKLGQICERNECRSVKHLNKMVPPFWFAHPRRQNGYNYVPPFYFQRWKHDAAHEFDTKVVPLLLFSRHETKDGVSNNVWPIIYHRTYLENGKRTGTRFAFLPLFWAQRNKGHSYGALPLVLTGWQHDPSRDFTEALVGGVVYYKHDHDATKRVVFPLYWDFEKQGSRFATVLPLAFYHRSGLASQTVLFPLFWRFKNDETKSDNILLFPLFDYAKRRAGRSTVFVSLLGGFERDLDAHRTQLFLLAPPFYHRRDRELSLDLLLPVFAHWHNKLTGSTGTYAGPFGRVSDANGSTSTFFPLFWHISDKRTGATTDLFLPLGGVHQRPGYKVGAVLLAFGWKKTPVDGVGEHGWGGGLAPVLFLGHSGTRTHAMLLPLFAWSKDASTGKQLAAIGPIFARTNRSTHGFDAGVLPLLFFGKDDHHSYGYLAPIFWYRHTPERTTVVVGPVYGSKGPQGDYDAGLAPLAFFHRKGTSNSQVVLPLFFRVAHGHDATTVVLPYVHSRHADTVTDAVFPLAFVQRRPGETTVGSLIGGYHSKDGRATGVFGPYIYHSDANAHSSTHVLFPLAFVHTSAESSLAAVFPLFWTVRNGTQRDTLLLPLIWHRRGGHTDVDAFLPLFVRAKNEHSTTWLFGPVYARHVRDGWTQFGLPGLFSFGQKHEGDKVSRFIGGPAFFYQRDDFAGIRRLIVGPLYVTRRPDGYTSGLVPLVFAWRRGTTSYAVTPFYYHQADHATGLDVNVVGPLYWGHSGGQLHLGLAPLFFGQYGQGRSKTVVFPLLYFSKRKTGSTLLTPLGGYASYEGGYKALIGPLFVRRDRDYSSTYLFPIIYHGVNKSTGSTTTVAFPLYFSRENKIDGKRIQAFTPLVWRYRSVERTITLGLPLVFDANVHGESRSTGVLPFFIRHHSEISKSTWWTVPPLLMWGRTRHPEGEPVAHDFVVFPLVWRFGGVDKSSTVVFPFYWGFRHGESRTQVIFPLGARWTRPDGDRTVVLNTYYRKGKGVREGSWKLNVIPFFDIGHPRTGDLEWNVLEGLFGYSRLGRNRTLKLFWVIPVPLKPVPDGNMSFMSNTPPSQRTEF